MMRGCAVSSRGACFGSKLHTDHAVIASGLREAPDRSATRLRSFATRSPRPLCCGLAMTSWKGARRRGARPLRSPWAHGSSFATGKRSGGCFVMSLSMKIVILDRAPARGDPGSIEKRVVSSNGFWMCVPCEGPCPGMLSSRVQNDDLVSWSRLQFRAETGASQ